MKVFLGNAFSLQMITTELTNGAVSVQITPVTKEEVATSNFTSVVGHVDTAAVLSDMLGVEVPFNRANVAIGKCDTLFVAQVVGGRLPEGATTLPAGFELTFLKVELL